MRVINKASFAVIAYCWDHVLGYEDDVSIEAGGAANLPVPGAGGIHHPVFNQTVICHEGPDDDEAYCIAIGKRICLAYENSGVTIRHHIEGRGIVKITTREGDDIYVSSDLCEDFGFKHGERIRSVFTGKMATVLGVTGLLPGKQRVACIPEGADILWIQIDEEEGASFVVDPQNSYRKC